MATIAYRRVFERRTVNREYALAHIVGFLGANLIIAPVALGAVALVTGDWNMTPPLLASALAEILGFLALGFGSRVVARASL
jgi:hypothetical protein